MLERLKYMLAPSEDLIQRTIEHPVDPNKMELAYYLPLCDENKIHNFITVPFSRNEYPFSQLLTSNPTFEKIEDSTTIIDLLLKGNAVLEYKGLLYSFDAMTWKYTDTSEIQTESAIRGPQNTISENPIFALNLIRNTYMSPELNISLQTLGNVSQTPLYTLYDQRKVNPSVLEELNKKLMDIKIDIVQTTIELERLLTNSERELFPTVIISERVDRIGRSLSMGKVVLLLKGSQFALILPATFFDFMHAVEDNYESYWITKLLIIVRYIALFMTITLPGLYVAILGYNPEFARLQLAFNLVASRSVVPYPAFVEVFIMLFLIEILVEASIRVPKLIGPTSTTVGGLILGTAIQQAGLVSSIMVIVTSLVAISNFVIPIYSMSLSIRFLKYPIIILAMFFGITGVFVGLFFYIVYLCQMRSFGECYFRIRTKLTPKEGDIKEGSAT